MDQILSTFGIDWRLLLINALNFGLLLLVLWKFLYGPLTRMLETRREKIAEGVHNAESANARLAEIEGSRDSMLAQAGKEADDIVSQARSSGSKRQKELVEAGEEAAASVLKEAQRQAEELKKNAITESKQEVAKLVVLGVEKTLATAKK